MRERATWNLQQRLLTRENRCGNTAKKMATLREARKKMRELVIICEKENEITG